MTDEQSSQPLTDTELETIRTRFDNRNGDMRSWGPVTLFHAAREVPRLLAEVDRLQGIVDAALTLHPAVANTELESAQDITTGRWIQPAQICGTCHVFNGPYDPCSRYMWPCPEARLLLGQEGVEKFVCQGEGCPGWKDSGICPQGLRHW